MAGFQQGGDFADDVAAQVQFHRHVRVLVRLVDAGEGNEDGEAGKLPRPLSGWRPAPEF